MPPFPGLIGPSYQASSYRADMERLVNLYPEKIESPDATFPACLLPTPGLTLFASPPNMQGRGLFAHNGRLWGAVGDRLYEIFQDGTTTSRGAIALGTNPVTWATNGVLGGDLMLTAGSTLYRLDIATSALTNPLAGAIEFVAFLDDRFIALNPGATQFNVSALLDGATWPGAGVAARSVQADPWQAMLVSHRLIYLLGTLTGEVWYDAGNDADQPFALDPSGVFQVGIAAVGTLKEHDNAPVWLSQTSDGAYIVVRMEGYAAQRISTHAIEKAISGYSTVSDAVAYTEQVEGHSFYTMVFPTANAAWSYDAATGLWHERIYWNSTLGTEQAPRAAFHAYAFGKHLVMDRITGKVYQASTGVATDVDGNGVRRLRRTAHLSADELRLFISRLQLNLDTGGGLVSGQGSNPQVMLRYSRDGGKTWSSERWVTAGALGAYSTRVLWNRLGSGRHWVFEIVVSDPVLSAAKWVAAYLDAEAGAA